jgi:hypothetical protein
MPLAGDRRLATCDWATSRLPVATRTDCPLRGAAARRILDTERHRAGSAVLAQEEQSASVCRYVVMTIRQPVFGPLTQAQNEARDGCGPHTFGSSPIEPRGQSQRAEET